MSWNRGRMLGIEDRINLASVMNEYRHIIIKKCDVHLRLKIKYLLKAADFCLLQKIFVKI